ncbi:MAG: hypothetical protein ACI8RA_000720 [Chlamydiales bacterium]
MNKISYELATVSNIFAIRLQYLRLMKHIDLEPQLAETGGGTYLDVAKRVGAYALSIWINPINLGMSWAGQFIFFRSLPTLNVPGIVVGGGLYAASYFDYWLGIKKVGGAAKKCFIEES